MRPRSAAWLWAGVALTVTICSPAPLSRAALAAPAPSPPADAKGVPNGPSAAVNDPVMNAQRPLDLAATSMQKLAMREHMMGFTGTEIDVAGHKVALYWYGSVPPAMGSLIRSLQSSMTIEVRQTPYSYATLDAEARRLIGMGSSVNPPIIDVGALPDYSGLQVTVEQTDATSTARIAPVPPRSSVRIVLKTGTRARVADCPPGCSGGRWNDLPPFWGGDAIGSGGGYCSTSFEAYHPGDNITGLLTAGHCGLNTNWSMPGNNNFVGTSAACCNPVDVTPVTKSHSLPNNDYGPVMRTGGYTSSSFADVINTGTNPYHAHRCLGGAFSGEVCGNVVQSTVLEYSDPGDGLGLRGPGVWVQQQNNVDSAGAGDSGGPMYTVDPVTGEITAMGVISQIAVPTNSNCNGIPRSARSAGCSSLVFVIDLISALNGINAGLVVSSPACASLGDTLQPNQTLEEGQCLKSANAQYDLIEQGDGNLVLYAPGPGQPLALWASGTQGNPGAYSVMQGDGNLVVYRQGGVALWGSGTQGNSGSYLVMQTDGNLVIYRQGGVAIWATNTQH
jgi:hypothetical protein